MVDFFSRESYFDVRCQISDVRFVQTLCFLCATVPPWFKKSSTTAAKWHKENIEERTNLTSDI